MAHSTITFTDYGDWGYTCCNPTSADYNGVPPLTSPPTETCIPGGIFVPFKGNYMSPTVHGQDYKKITECHLGINKETTSFNSPVVLHVEDGSHILTNTGSKAIEKGDVLWVSYPDENDTKSQVMAGGRISTKLSHPNIDNHLPWGGFMALVPEPQNNMEKLIRIVEHSQSRGLFISSIASLTDFSASNVGTAFNNYHTNMGNANVAKPTRDELVTLFKNNSQSLTDFYRNLQLLNSIVQPRVKVVVLGSMNGVPGAIQPGQKFHGHVIFK